MHRCGFSDFVCLCLAAKAVIPKAFNGEARGNEDMSQLEVIA